MFFAALVLFAAFLIEGIGTYVSVVGLSSLFAANMVIIILAIALDIGKVTSVSFLYKYWRKINVLMKTYMTVAAMVLMLITSAGAFGYLSGQFQKAISNTNQNGVILTALTEEQGRLQKRKEEIDTQIAKLPDSSVSGRRALMRQFAPEVERINTRLIDIDKKLPELKVENLKQGVEVGPILYVAEAFDTTPEKAVKWVILTIIFVFDPLAIALLLAGNYLIEERKKPIIQPPVVQDEDTPQVVPAAEAIKPPAPVVETPPLIVPVPELVPEIVQLVEEPIQESVEFPTKEDDAALMAWAKKQEELELAEEVEPILRIAEPVPEEIVIPVLPEEPPQPDNTVTDGPIENQEHDFPDLETLPAHLDFENSEFVEIPDEQLSEEEFEKILDELHSAPEIEEAPRVMDQALEAAILGEAPQTPVEDAIASDVLEAHALAEEIEKTLEAQLKAQEEANAIREAERLAQQARINEREIIRLNEVTKQQTPKPPPVYRSQLEDISAKSDVETDEGNQRIIKSLSGTYAGDSIPELQNIT